MLQTPVPIAYLVNFGPDAIEFSLNFWIADPEAGVANVKSLVNIAMLKGLREAGIDIPFPQRVIHIGNATEVANAVSSNRGTMAEPVANASNLPPRGDA